MDEEENSNSTLYNRMVSHLGDYIANVRKEEKEDTSSLFKSLESISSDKRYINEIPLAKGGMKEIFRAEDLY